MKIQSALQPGPDGEEELVDKLEIGRGGDKLDLVGVFVHAVLT